MCLIRIGGERAEFLALTHLRRSHPGRDDFRDGHWIRASVEVSAGGFRGEVEGDLRADELSAFHRDLTPLAGSLVGTAGFRTLERWPSIRVSGDGRGHMEVDCEVGDRPGVGNTLAVRLDLDQKFLTSMVAQLARAISEYPVIGRPDA